MSEEIIKSLFALLAAALTVWGTLHVSKRSDKAQRRKEAAEANEAEQNRIKSIEDSLWERMESKLQEQDQKILALETRLTESERARRDQERIIRNLEDRERDREELIQDFLERHMAVDKWFRSGGYSPPLPRPSWRIEQAVEQYINEQKGVG